MKRYLSLIIVVLVISSIFLTGCGSSSNIVRVNEQDLKKLSDCFSLTRNLNSMEVDVTSDTKAQGQSIDLSMNMKVEDIKKNMKCSVIMDMNGQHQEYYIGMEGTTASVYTKKASGGYSVSKVDSSKLGDTDVTKSLANYVDLIESNPDYFTKTDDNTYQLDVPQEKISEVYSQITGKSSMVKLSSMILEFVIGYEGYLQDVNLTSGADSIEIKLNTRYFNYNKKFNIALPDVSN